MKNYYLRIAGAFALILLLAFVVKGRFSYGTKAASQIASDSINSTTPQPIPKDRKTILIVYSYHKEWGWNTDTKRGVIDGLAKEGYELNQNYILHEFYMDTKNTYTTPAHIQTRADAATRLIKECKPDLVIVNDDNALKHVAVPYEDESLPFLFAGINAAPEKSYPHKITSLDRPGHNITGALERFPYYQSFSLAKRIFPNKTKVMLFADTSLASKFLVGAFQDRYLDKVTNSPLEVVGIAQVKTFSEWKKHVLEAQDKADFLGILTYHQLRGEDDRVVSATDVVHWTTTHNKLPELGFLLFHAEDGFWSAVGVSPYKTGKYLAQLTARVFNGEYVANMPIVDPQLLDVAFNRDRSRQLGINVPIDILGMATEVYKTTEKPRY